MDSGMDSLSGGATADFDGLWGHRLAAKTIHFKTARSGADTATRHR